MPSKEPVPVLTIDGPSGSGKGTISRPVAETLGWHLLDSGALYRAVGYAAGSPSWTCPTPRRSPAARQRRRIRFAPSADGGETRVLVNGHDATDEIRTETCGAGGVRHRRDPGRPQGPGGQATAFRKPPGLVADGRDMGTVIFPDARLQGIPYGQCRGTSEKAI